MDLIEYAELYRKYNKVKEESDEMPSNDEPEDIVEKVLEIY